MPPVFLGVAGLCLDGLFQTADDSAYPDPREDFDGIIDTDGCHDSPGADIDADGDIDIGDLLAAFYGRIGTSCA